MPTDWPSSWPKPPRKPRCTPPGWTPTAAYDEAVDAFVRAVLADGRFVGERGDFLADQRIVARGRRNSLAQTALLLTCPGVPDVYQGGELWDLSLVDPDNRRPVDYGVRRRLLPARARALLPGSDRRDDAGVSKLWLSHRLLDPPTGSGAFCTRPRTTSRRRSTVPDRATRSASARESDGGCRAPAWASDDWGDTSVDAAGRAVDRRPDRSIEVWRTVPSFRALRGVPGRRAAAGPGVTYQFSVWAPGADHVEVVIAGQRHWMHADERGWWRFVSRRAGVGTRYGFSLDGGPARPDPRSPSQPDGIDGLSEVVEPDGDLGGPTGAGEGCRFEARCCTSCTSGPSPRRHLRRGHRAPAAPRRSRSRRHRAPAGRRVLGRLGGGATTASTCLRPTTPTAVRTA